MSDVNKWFEDNHASESYPHAIEKAMKRSFLAGHSAGLSEGVESMREWRDAYALCLEVALKHGIFANKAAVKREIEALLVKFYANRGKGV